MRCDICPFLNVTRGILTGNTRYLTFLYFSSFLPSLVSWKHYSPILQQFWSICNYSIIIWKRILWSKETGAGDLDQTKGKCCFTVKLSGTLIRQYLWLIFKKRNAMRQCHVFRSCCRDNVPKIKHSWYENTSRNTHTHTWHKHVVRHLWTMFFISANMSDIVCL